MLTEADLKSIGEAIDRLTTVPMANWTILKGLPIWKLYEAAREKAREPLSLFAASRLIKSVEPKDSVIVTTGFTVTTVHTAETDGPTGAAVLARAIDLGLRATPVIVTEESFQGIMRATCQAAGLNTHNLKEAKMYPRRTAVEPFPIDPEKAKKMAQKMLDDVNPSAIISVERPGRNEKGVHHSGGGFDVSPFTAKVDDLVEEARSRGIFTVGIGDLGNELGMGYIRDAVKEIVPGATKCKCPCGAGIAAATETDALIVATVSNWGAYGLAACMATVLEEPEVFHDMLTEKLLLRASSQAGAVDSVSGLSRPAADGVGEEITCYVVEMLRHIIQIKLNESMFTREYKKIVR
jgi:hypothetical protein